MLENIQINKENNFITETQPHPTQNQQKSNIKSIKSIKTKNNYPYDQNKVPIGNAKDKNTKNLLNQPN